MNIFLKTNSIQIPPVRKRMFDDVHIACSVLLKEIEGYVPESTGFYVRFIDEKRHFIELRFNSATGLLETLLIISSKNLLKVQEKINRTFIPMINNYALCFDRVIPHSNNLKKYDDIKGTINIVFDGDILLIHCVTQEIYYHIQESSELGVLVDKNFNVSGFLIKNITEIEKTTLEKYYGNAQEKIPYYPLVIQESPRKEQMIDVLLSLKNIEYDYLLYYGFKGHLIDEKFCVNFAGKYIEVNATSLPSSFLFQCASVLHPTHKNINELFIAFVDPIKFENNRIIYNKLWFYILLVDDLKENSFWEPDK
jgi:hypothetical protein